MVNLYYRRGSTVDRLLFLPSQLVQFHLPRHHKGNGGAKHRDLCPVHNITLTATRTWGSRIKHVAGIAIALFWPCPDRRKLCGAPWADRASQTRRLSVKSIKKETRRTRRIKNTRRTKRVRKTRRMMRMRKTRRDEADEEDETDEEDEEGRRRRRG